MKTKDNAEDTVETVASENTDAWSTMDNTDTIYIPRGSMDWTYIIIKTSATQTANDMDARKTIEATNGFHIHHRLYGYQRRHRRATDSSNCAKVTNPMDTTHAAHTTSEFIQTVWNTLTEIKSFGSDGSHKNMKKSRRYGCHAQYGCHGCHQSYKRNL